MMLVALSKRGSHLHNTSAPKNTELHLACTICAGDVEQLKANFLRLVLVTLTSNKPISLQRVRSVPALLLGRIDQVD